MDTISINIHPKRDMLRGKEDHYFAGEPRQALQGDLGNVVKTMPSDISQELRLSEKKVSSVQYQVEGKVRRSKKAAPQNSQTLTNSSQLQKRAENSNKTVTNTNPSHTEVSSKNFASNKSHHAQGLTLTTRISTMVTPRDKENNCYGL